MSLFFASHFPGSFRRICWLHSSAFDISFWYKTAKASLKELYIRHPSVDTEVIPSCGFWTSLAWEPIVSDFFVACLTYMMPLLFWSARAWWQILIKFFTWMILAISQMKPSSFLSIRHLTQKDSWCTISCPWGICLYWHDCPSQNQFLILYIFR